MITIRRVHRLEWLSFVAARYGIPMLLVRANRPSPARVHRTAITLAALDAGLAPERVLAGQLTDPEWQRLSHALAAAADVPLWIHELPRAQLSRLPRDLARAHADHSVRLVVLDASLPAHVARRVRALTRSGPLTVLSPDSNAIALRRLLAARARRTATPSCSPF
ncbi:hypothetical protein AB0F17_59575 [Nonomuraea sp. NPDC026600]|uniref:hypothetical protein n=1 Tax=Nonomuraea sp. NPDC026600 TaxID=3155363 RepID=UPI0033D8ECAD